MGSADTMLLLAQLRVLSHYLLSFVDFPLRVGVEGGRYLGLLSPSHGKAHLLEADQVEVGHRSSHSTVVEKEDLVGHCIGLEEDLGEVGRNKAGSGVEEEGQMEERIGLASCWK